MGEFTVAAGRPTAVDVGLLPVLHIVIAGRRHAVELWRAQVEPFAVEVEQAIDALAIRGANVANATASGTGWNGNMLWRTVKATVSGARVAVVVHVLIVRLGACRDKAH